MSLDYWLPEYPYDYLILVGILTEFLLAIVFSNLQRRRRTASNSRLREQLRLLGLVGLGEGERRFAVMVNTSAVAFSGGVLVFLGWVFSFGVFAEVIPVDIAAEIEYLTPERLVLFICISFAIQFVGWLPLFVSRSTLYLVTPDGIWKARGPGKDLLIGWGEVRDIRFGWTGALYGYTLRTDRGTLHMRVDMTGFSEFAKLSVEKVSAENRPTGRFALEQFAATPPGYIWYQAPWVRRRS